MQIEGVYDLSKIILGGWTNLHERLSEGTKI